MNAPENSLNVPVKLVIPAKPRQSSQAIPGRENAAIPPCGPTFTCVRRDSVQTRVPRLWLPLQLLRERRGGGVGGGSQKGARMSRANHTEPGLRWADVGEQRAT